MQRGFTLAELAVALALLGVLALGLALLLGQMGRGSQRAQAEAQLHADLQEVRARLTEDVLLSTSLDCTPERADLVLPSRSVAYRFVAYRFEGGQLLRNGVPLTLQGGYGGSFSCDGRTLTLSLTWEGTPVATLTATRRVGLSLANGLDEGDFPMDLTEAKLQNNRRISGVRWRNLSGRRLFLFMVSVLAPNGYTVNRIQMGGTRLFLNDFSYRPVPAKYNVSPPYSALPGDTLRLGWLQFTSSVANRGVRLEFRFCLINTSPCPPSQEVGLEYSFSCTKAGCRAL